MSHFVEGILSCGVEGEMSKSIALATENFKNQMEQVKALAQGYGDASIAQANAVADAENKMADVEYAQADTQLYTGAFQIASPVSTFGVRIGREKGVGLFGGSELKKISEEGNNLDAWKKALQEGDFEVASGEKPNPISKAAISDEEIDNLRNGKFGDKKPEGDPRLETIKALKGLRNAKGKDDADDMVNRSKAYDDIEEKLKDEEKQVSNRRSEYDRQTENITTYIRDLSQAATSFSGGQGGRYAASLRHDQAALDADKARKEYASSNERSAYDTALQGSQNAVQAINELARAKAEIAQANRM